MTWVQAALFIMTIATLIQCWFFKKFCDANQFESVNNGRMLNLAMGCSLLTGILPLMMLVRGVQ